MGRALEHRWLLYGRLRSCLRNQQEVSAQTLPLGLGHIDEYMYVSVLWACSVIEKVAEKWTLAFIAMDRGRLT